MEPMSFKDFTVRTGLSNGLLGHVMDSKYFLCISLIDSLLHDHLPECVLNTESFSKISVNCISSVLKSESINTNSDSNKDHKRDSLSRNISRVSANCSMSHRPNSYFWSSISSNCTLLNSLNVFSISLDIKSRLSDVHAPAVNTKI